ncbi:MAG: hypothetical protein GY820_22440 [Gammaproteobacteria bacterium]|nr:hypothetical protein [Gammaproteobacteria bacterium]
MVQPTRSPPSRSSTAAPTRATQPRRRSWRRRWRRFRLIATTTPTTAAMSGAICASVARGDGDGWAKPSAPYSPRWRRSDADEEVVVAIASVRVALAAGVLGLGRGVGCAGLRLR